jgi:hypothetical protein
MAKINKKLLHIRAETLLTMTDVREGLIYDRYAAYYEDNMQKGIMLEFEHGRLNLTLTPAETQMLIDFIKEKY